MTFDDKKVEFTDMELCYMWLYFEHEQISCKEFEDKIKGKVISVNDDSVKDVKDK